MSMREEQSYQNAVMHSRSTESSASEPHSETWEVDSVAQVQHDPRAVRWNLTALMLDVTFFSLGMAFLDQNAVLPLLLQRLGASGALIGGFASIRFLVFSLFQIFVAHYTHGQPRQKPLLAFVAITTRLPLLALPWFLWHGGSTVSRAAALWVVIILISFWALGDGLGYVPWMEIVARAFSSKTRGRFFASTQLTSGIITVAIAFIVAAILASPRLPFPHNYALLAGIAAVMYQVSMVGVLLIREPPLPAAMAALNRSRPPLTHYVRRLPALVRSNPIFGRLATIQLLIGAGATASPFYILYATSRFHLGDAWGGRYQVLQAVGIVILMPVWTLISERSGPGASVRGVALACCMTPLIALTLGRQSPWLFGLVFLIMGGSLNWGLWITLNHYLLTHLAEEERSIFVALFNLLFVPSALYPFFGGLLLKDRTLLSIGSVPILFALTALVTGTGLTLAMRLPSLEVAGHV